MSAADQQSRRAIRVCGLVQGVGFRPFVHRLAVRLGLTGFVRNIPEGVCIEVEGATSRLERFLDELVGTAPPLARIQDLRWVETTPRNDAVFQIEPSELDAAGSIWIGADLAPCAECLAELFTPGDRRYRYPFLNCTNCGPRLTVIQAAPYDRARTTLAPFVLCAACRAEYENPSNRRFHAEATACPDCGPSLKLLASDGAAVPVDDPLAEAVQRLRNGQIAAIKGLGGYHLVCAAGNEAAVATLRRRKHRDEKPLAIMVASAAAAERLCHVSEAERELLESSRRPIVLLRKRRDRAGVAENVAPRNPALGVMLPYTPLHQLLLHDLDGMPLVATSGNVSDEPIVYEDGAAVTQLGGIADFFLVHNRPIQIRCDDSVTRHVAGMELPWRRSRGSAPLPIELPVHCPQPLLAVGGQSKSTVALSHGRTAVLSQHLGDLDHYAAERAFRATVEHYERLFAIRPQVVVHDLHPDYASTRYALERAANEGLPAVGVQHHHAHVAAGMVDNGLNEPVIGVGFDGTGYGLDGAIWGGEFFVGDYRQFRRAAHFRYVPLPGGDRAVREPWRMALAHLIDADVDDRLLPLCGSNNERRLVRRMIEQRINAPFTSSVGRLFDAVAALAGIRHRVSYEGQAAMELEWAAAEIAPCDPYPWAIRAGSAPGAPHEIDTRPLIRAVASDVGAGISPALIGRRFHSTMAACLVEVCQKLRAETAIAAVVLSGGVFMNAILLTEAVLRLTAEGFRVYRHRETPPNDGGLCLGQLAIAAAARNVPSEH